MDPTKTLPDQSDPKTRTRRVLDELAAERASHGHGEAVRIDRRMNRAKGYLGRVLRGELRLDVETLFAALDALDADPADFFARAVGVRVRPERLLARFERRAAEDGPSVLDLFELHLDGDRVEVSVDPGSAFRDVVGLEEKLDRLEETSFSDPDAALVPMEGALGAAVRRLRLEGGFANREVVCRALGLAAAIYRRKGRLGLAARCLRTGFRLSEPRDYRAVRAELLQRAGYLLGDHGEYETALELVREATEIYVLLGDGAGLGRSLVDRAVLLTALGDVCGAIEAYERSLKHLPADLWFNRCSALQGLGFNHLYLGNLELASRYAAEAADLHQTRTGPNWSRLLWLQGEIALKRKDATAEHFLLGALGALGETPNLFDLAIVSLRLAQTLLLEGRVAEVQAVAADMMRLLHPLRNHRIASAALSEVTRATLKGELTLELLDEVCLELEREKGRPVEGRPPGAA